MEKVVQKELRQVTKIEEGNLGQIDTQGNCIKL